MTRLSIFTVLGASLLAACDCAGAGPRAGGATPYVRCAMREPPAIEAHLGALHLHSEGRVLTIEGAPDPVRLAAFRGAALAEEPLEPALDAIESGAPAMQLVLGSLGDDEAHVETLLRALATLTTPSIVVMGGRDHPADLVAAMAALPEDARERIIDASGFRTIAIGGVALVPVSGAPEGRYARDDQSCGLGAADIDAMVSDLGERGEHARYLVGYAAPSPLAGIEGGEAGSALVAALATRTGARAGLFAWPDVPTPMLVPPLAGPPALLADGSRIGPGVRLVEVSGTGLVDVPAR